MTRRSLKGQYLVEVLVEVSDIFLFSLCWGKGKEESEAAGGGGGIFFLLKIPGGGVFCAGGGWGGEGPGGCL